MSLTTSFSRDFSKSVKGHDRDKKAAKAKQLASLPNQDRDSQFAADRHAAKSSVPNFTKSFGDSRQGGDQKNDMHGITQQNKPQRQAGMGYPAESTKTKKMFGGLGSVPNLTKSFGDSRRGGNQEDDMTSIAKQNKPKKQADTGSLAESKTKKKSRFVGCEFIILFLASMAVVIFFFIVAILVAIFPILGSGGLLSH